MDSMLLPLHLTLLVTGAIATLAGAALAWPHRRTPAGATLLLLLLAIAEWQVSGALGVSSTSLERKRAWGEVQYVGIAAVPPVWLHFVMRYLGDARARSRGVLVATVLPALITMGAAFSSGRHALLWSSVELVPTPDGMRGIFHHGPLFWVMAGCNYLLLIAATALLVRAQRPAVETIATQRRLMLAAGAIPWIANLLYLANVTHGIDPTPLAFGITGVCAAVAVADLGLLELSPARLWRSRQD